MNDKWTQLDFLINELNNEFIKLQLKNQKYSSLEKYASTQTRVWYTNSTHLEETDKGLNNMPSTSIKTVNVNSMQLMLKKLWLNMLS